MEENSKTNPIIPDPQSIDPYDELETLEDKVAEVKEDSVVGNPATEEKVEAVVENKEPAAEDVTEKTEKPVDEPSDKENEAPDIPEKVTIEISPTAEEEAIKAMNAANDSANDSADLEKAYDEFIEQLDKPVGPNIDDEKPNESQEIPHPMNSDPSASPYSYGPMPNNQNPNGAAPNGQIPNGQIPNDQMPSGVPMREPDPVKWTDWLPQLIVGIIPFVNILVYIYWMFSDKTSKVKVEFCKAWLVVQLVSYILLQIFYMAMGVSFFSMLNWLA